MCIVCQAVTVGAAALTGILPVSVSEPQIAQPIPETVSTARIQAASIGGTTCKKVGEVRTVGRRSFRCETVGSRRLWRRSISTSTLPPTTTTTAASTSPTVSLSGREVLLPVDECKIRSLDAHNDSLIRSGFPRHPDAALPNQEAVVQVIPVAYPNLRGVKSPSEVLKPIADGVTDYYLKVSGGRVRFVWRLPAEVLMMPNPIEQYGLGGRNNGYEFVQDVLTATDHAVDFTGADFVLVLNPETATSSQIATSPAQQMSKRWKFRTQEGDIFRSTFTSPVTAQSIGWIVIAHEFAHGLGLPDTYKYASTGKFMGEFDLMGSYLAIELSAWHKWQLGFIDDSQVHCLRPNTEAQLWISHVSADSKRPEMIVIPTSASTAIVIEARRKERFDRTAAFTLVPDGLLVYEVNTAYGTGQGPLRAVAKEGFTPGDPNGLVGLNQQIRTGQYVISSSEVGMWGHVVRIRQSP